MAGSLSFPHLSSPTGLCPLHSAVTEWINHSFCGSLAVLSHSGLPRKIPLPLHTDARNDLRGF
jgi:hypothetical protein